MDRRNFIKTGALSAALLANGRINAGSTAKLKTLPHYGIIITSQVDWFRSDPRKALQTLADEGYSEIEFSGELGIPDTEAKKIFKDLGIKPLIGGGAMYQLIADKEAFKEAMEDCRKWGKKYFACYYPFLDSQKIVPIDEWKKVCDRMNEAGRRCREEGVKLLYHNHDYEFNITEGIIPYDIILQYTDPELVGIEMDIYWLEYGGQSAIHFLKKYPGRFPVIHLTDIDHTTAKGFADMGQGIIPYTDIMPYTEIGGTRHFIAECNRAEVTRENVVAAARYLAKMKYQSL
ncbi:MAG: sugar phosphate isomerase/epimerase [Bacteroidales bacterium]|nr:sugar phosphate isomerase/epimerase [Bacteroidales bacterium]